MKLLILGGNSEANKVWVEKVKNYFSDKFELVEILNYKNWNEKQPMIDIDHESKRLSKMNLTEYLILAKSVGAQTVIKAAHDFKIFPEASVFLGTSVKWGRNKGFDIDGWIKEYALRTLFIEKTNDPFFSYEELRNWLEENRAENYTLNEIPGEDHEYDDFKTIELLIINFLTKK